MTDTYVPGGEYESEVPDDRPPAAARVRPRPGTSRVPPQALDAERAVLAAMMLDSTAIAVTVQTVMPEDFYRPAHQKICAAVYRMFEKNEAVDIVTLSEELKSAGDLEAVGGQVHLAEILDSSVTAANVEYHARIVREKSLLRQMIRATSEIGEEAYTSPDDVNGFIDRAEHKMFEISEGGPRKGFVAVKDLLQESFDKIEELYNEKRLVTGVPTGFVDLDTLTSGFQKSDFIVVAARPSMGKTAFTLNVAEHVAVDHRLPVAFFSLEMSKEALVQRLLSSLSRVDGNRLRTGFLRENEWPRLTTAAGRLSEAELWIDDTAGITALEIRAKARRLMVETKGRLAMVVIDYLQLIRGHGRQENRQQEISHISRSLKALAKELKLPVVALSQLKRPTDVKEGGRRPVLSDLRECVTGDTLVVLANGERVPVRNLVGAAPEVVSVTEAGRLTTARADRVWSVGVRPVFEVKLACGRTVRATAEHRFLAGGGWRHVENLAAGDRLALSRDASGEAGSAGIQGRPRRSAAGAVLLLEDPAPADAATRDLFWDRVLSVEPAGDEEVFDLTVPGPSCWLADGIVSHNSGAIEQDADVVVFIHRPEVYGVQDKEGVAELILGKQRNGPIGLVEIAFQKSITRFENLARVRE